MKKVIVLVYAEDEAYVVNAALESYLGQIDDAIRLATEDRTLTVDELLQVTSSMEFQRRTLNRLLGRQPDGTDGN